MGTYVIVCWKEMSVRYISNRDMTKGFVAGASPRIARKIAGKYLKDALQENVPRICRGDMSHGCVAGKGPRDKLYYKY